MSSRLNGLTKETTIQLLNQGSYGCVFRPAIKCDGTLSDNTFVTKIQEDTEFIKNEVAVSAIIKKIKHYSSPTSILLIGWAIIEIRDRDSVSSFS